MTSQEINQKIVECMLKKRIELMQARTSAEQSEIIEDQLALIAALVEYTHEKEVA